jgi:outer membrane protein assembly factor BamB
MTLANLRKELDRVKGPVSLQPARGPEGAPGLDARWAQPTAREGVTRNWLQSAMRRQEAGGEPVLPVFSPVIADGRVIYRSYRGLHAVDLQTGQEAWEAPCRWSLDRLVIEPRYAPYVESWVDIYLETSAHVLFSHTVLGTLSTDGHHVYAVDDLGVPPCRLMQRGGRFRQQEPAWPDFGSELTDAAYHSRLLALDAASGKLVWEVGSREKEPGAGPLANTYFLGAPLLRDGRLYALTERTGQLSLTCLQAESGAVVWQQALAVAPVGLLQDPGRRLHAAQPVYGEGVIVCPTHAGVILGVDLHTRNLVWAYPYRTEALTQSQSYGFRRGRVSPAPCDGRVDGTEDARVRRPGDRHRRG